MTITTVAPTLDDEKSLLIRLELLLEREEELLATRDTAGMAAIAEEREQLVERVGHAARRRRAGPRPTDEADLVELYRRLRHNHAVRAQVIRRQSDRNSSAVRVLAHAMNDTGLYQADGSVKMQFVAAA
jgi:flagellar biosynthesis/type III secretory pathway chaperone